MNELVKIENDRMITTSKIIAETFGKRHDHVLRDIDNIRKDVPNFGEMFHETETQDSYGRQQRIYEITRDGFSLLAMGFTGAEAMEWKIKYLEAFNKLEAFWNSPEQIMARAHRIAEQTIASLEQKLQQKDFLIEQNKPKALFADAVASSKTSILIGELAKIICQNGYQIGQKRLFNWLRENGYLMKASNLPTQRYIEQGLFEIKESTITTGDGVTRITKTTKVTGKGQIYFVNKFLGASA
jgi:anti-repressor protein